MAAKMKPLDIASWVLCTLGALVVGIDGAFGYNAIANLLGMGGVAKVVSIVIGLGGLFSLWHMVTYKKK